MSGVLQFAALAANPFGGLLVAVPYALLRLGFSPWATVIAGAPLAYLQVVVVDLGWGLFDRFPAWRRLLEKRRSPRVERLLQSRGGFWITFVAAPLIGPWLVMAFMRFAQVPQRKVAAPILLSLVVTAAAVAVLTRLGMLVGRT
ncbi:MAG TPA: hypothetical protein VLV15_12345 [Dongiaceae bacterium]|nr:hypothetical protein [Dongiaceae bacterium]